MEFVDVKRFSPVVHEGDLPWEEDYFHKRPDEISNEFLDEGSYIIDDEWWKKQMYRCLNGYEVPNAIRKGGDAFIDGKDAIWTGNDCYLPAYDLLIKDRVVHITGRHYFYLNFWKIHGKVESKKLKGMIPPRFIMLDFFFARRIEMMFEQEKDGQETKSRQIGASEKIGGMVLGWNYSFVPASVNIVIGGTQEDSDHTQENAIKGVDNLINTQFYKIPGKNTFSFRRAKYYGSELRSLTAKDNPQSLSRFTPYVVVCEEIGKWKRDLIKEVLDFVSPSLEAESTKTGYLFLIGTGGSMEMGAKNLEEMHYDPKAYNLLSFKNIWEREPAEDLSESAHFTPKWMFKIIDKDGNPKKEESIKRLKEQMKVKKPKDRYTFKSQYAIYGADAFLISKGGFFGEMIIQACQIRKAFIKTHSEAQVVERGYLRFKDRSNMGKGVTWHPDSEGPIMIAEHPETDSNGDIYGNLYRAGTDSYDQDEAHTSSSKGACWIKKGFLNADHTYNKYVAGVVERPSLSEGGREVFYEYTAMLCLYYNALNLIEHSKTIVLDWYKYNNLEWILKERPRFVTSKMVMNTKVSNMYGIDAATKPDWLKMQRDFLSEVSNIENTDFIMLLEAWAKFQYNPNDVRYNCDITIATSLCTVFEEDEKDKIVYSQETINENSFSFPYYKSRNGILEANLK